MVFHVGSRQKNTTELLILMTARLFGLVVMCLILPWISCFVCVCKLLLLGSGGLIFFMEHLVSIGGATKQNFRFPLMVQEISYHFEIAGKHFDFLEYRSY